MAWLAKEASKIKSTHTSTVPLRQAVHVYTTIPLHTHLTALRGVCEAAKSAHMTLHIVLCSRISAATDAAAQFTPAYLAAAAAAAELGCTVSRLDTGVTCMLQHTQHSAPLPASLCGVPACVAVTLSN